MKHHLDMTTPLKYSWIDLAVQEPFPLLLFEFWLKWLNNYRLLSGWAILLLPVFHFLCYYMAILVWWYFLEESFLEEYSNILEYLISCQCIEMSCVRTPLWQIWDVISIWMHLFFSLYLLDFDLCKTLCKHDCLFLLSYLDYPGTRWRC